MQGSRYLVGWAVVTTIATAVGVGTVVLVRDAVGGGTVVSTLSQQDIRDQLSAAAQTAGTGSQPSIPGPSDPSGATRGPSRPSPTPTARPGPTGAAAPSASHRPSPSPSGSPGPGRSQPPSPSPSASSVTGVLSSPGGSVVARCADGSAGASVYLLSWSPAQGYAVNQVARGPGQEAEISFESDSGSVDVHVSCLAAGPVEQVQTGGGDGGGGGGDG